MSKFTIIYLLFTCLPSICFCQSPIYQEDILGLIGETFEIHRSPQYTNWSGETTYYYTPGPPGMNQVWDLSTFTSNTVSQVIMLDDTSGQYWDQFLGSEFVYKISNETSQDQYYYYSFDSTAIYGHGVNRGSYYEHYDNLELIVDFPIIFGNTNTDSYSGQTSPWPTPMGDFPMPVSGDFEYEVDGYGTVILPYGTIEDVYRIKYEGTDYFTDYDYTLWYPMVGYVYYKAGVHFKLAHHYRIQEDFLNQIFRFNEEYLDEAYVSDINFESDVDNDGIYDQNDNCSLDYNPMQEDIDNDGYGDLCDVDIDGDGSLNVIDCDSYNEDIFVGAECDDGIIDTYSLINEMCICEAITVNSHCQSAIEVIEGIYYDNGPSTGNAASLNCYPYGADHASWYLYVPSSAGMVYISSLIDSNDPDTRLSVYSGNCDELICVVQNDDFNDFDASYVEFDVILGEQYWLEFDDRRSSDPFSFEINMSSFVLDSDLDGVLDIDDNCDDTPNPDQLDLDQDNIGDICDEDIDGDGIDNVNDCDAYDSNVYDGATCDDGNELTIGDVIIEDCSCSGLLDIDSDSIPDEIDNCISISNPNQEDLDNDGVGDVCDDDIDGDGDINELDCDDTDPNIYYGAVCDDDDPFIVEEIIDENCVCSGLLDTDADSIPDEIDNCVSISNSNQEDLDEDGLGNLCDDDIDGDGDLNGVDCDVFDSNIFYGANCDDGDPLTVGEIIDDSCDCSSVVGVADLNLPDSFLVSPNPAHDYLILSGADINNVIRIFNSVGQLIYESQCTERIDISQFSNGLYFIEIDVESSIFQRMKFIKY